MEYRGIELEVSEKKASFGHSIMERNHNVEWMDKLSEIPWKNLKEPFADNYEAVCRLYSLYHMNYQICNGGIDQYFFNGYHEFRDAHHEDDVVLLDIEEQKVDFAELVFFAESIFPDRKEENESLKMTMKAFQKLWLEKEVEVIETIECWEDQYLYDSETNEEYENPEWFESYDDIQYVDMIRGFEINEDEFNRTFYESSDYLEELFELKAQYCCKSFIKEFEKQADRFPEEKKELQDIFGDLMGPKGKTLQELIDEAKKSGAMQKEKEEKTIVKKNERSL